MNFMLSERAKCRNTEMDIQVTWIPRRIMPVQTISHVQYRLLTKNSRSASDNSLRVLVVRPENESPQAINLMSRVFVETLKRGYFR